MSLAQLVREGATVIPRCEVWLDEQLQGEVDIESGVVTYDSSRRVLRTCRVQLNHTGGLLDHLAPVGSWLKLYRGARDFTGEEFMEPLGVYAFEESSMQRIGGRVDISGTDFSQLVADARWEDPYETGSGNAGTIIETGLASRLPFSIDFNFATTSHSIGNRTWGLERENNPWKDFQDVATAIGRNLMFDRQARATLEPVPDPDTSNPSYIFEAGEEPTFLGSQKILRGRPYNVVVARGEPEDGPVVKWTAEDDNPSSISYVGRYRKPYFLTNGYMSTEAQVQDAAEAQLKRLLGLGEVITLEVIPLPFLDVWKVIRAIDPRLGVDANYVIDKYTLPVRTGGSRGAVISTRRRLVA